jgi:uncharacterized protein with von Willebrand factor type A (vWA) domain
MVEIHYQQGALAESDGGSKNKATLYSFRRCPYAIRARLALAAGKLVLPLDARPTRRFRPDPLGPRVDIRATIRAAHPASGADMAD